MQRQAVTERSDAGPPDLQTAAFTGRERELAALGSALADPPAVVQVEGEAGIGKTRLVSEYLATGQGRASKTLVACCPPFRTPHTLGPVADALRQATDGQVAGLGLSGLAGALRPLFPEWDADLPPTPEPAEDATAARHRLFAALAEMLARLQVRVLAVEDLHWADEATLEFLLYLAAGRPPPVSLLVTFRPEDVPAGSLLPRLTPQLSPGTASLRLRLGPLGVPETGGLVSSMLSGQQITGEFAAFLHQHADGVPLAIEELVRLLASQADLTRRGSRWVRRELDTIGVPPTIRDTVLQRAARLSPDARTVLQAAAVLAAPAAEATVQQMTDLPSERLRGGLAQALGSRLLAEDSRGLILFWHALAAQAIYAAISGPDRRLLHRRAGQALESTKPPPLARVARHFREAGDTVRWSRYAEQAAEAAVAAGDEAGAGELLADLVAGARLPPGEASRLTGKIVLLALPMDGRLRDLASALRLALDAPDLEPCQEAELRFQLGRVLFTMDEYEASRAELERAASSLPPGSLHAVRAMTLLGWPHGLGVTASVRVRWLRRAAQAAGSLDPRERLRLLVSRATALLALGDPEGWAAAAAIPDLPSAAGERLQVTRAHWNIGEAAKVWGRYGEAGQRLARAIELTGTYDYSLPRGDVLVLQAHLDWLTGAWDGLAPRAAALSEDEGLRPAARLQAVLVTGLLDAAAGDRDRAEERLRQVLGDALRRGAVEYATEPAAALARLALTRGESEASLKITDEPAGIIARKGTWIWAAELAPARVEALAAVGRCEEAAALTAAFARGLRGRDAPAPKAGLALCRALLARERGEPARAAAAFARAAAAWTALPRPYDALLAHEQQARCLVESGRPESGLAMLGEAERGLAELGATGDADRVARSLRQHGATVPRVWRGGRRGYGGQLSPAELDAVRLHVAGLPRRDIARTLYRSPKTVDNQLNSAMRKLGASSRTALAVKAVAAGIAPGVQPDVSS
jgi:DNA-binding CsgD family transcriptional regulator